MAAILSRPQCVKQSISDGTVPPTALEPVANISLSDECFGQFDWLTAEVAKKFSHMAENW